MKEGPPDESGSVGDRMYALVERYAELGDHRTGTDVDDATRDLVADELEARGAAVTRVPYEFDRYEVEASVTVDGESVSCVPLYYAGTGRVAGRRPFVGSLEMLGGVAAVDLEARRSEAREAGVDVAVLATGDGEGRLVAENAAPELVDGPLTVFVPGADARQLEKGNVTVDVAAGIVPGQSETVVGRFGDVDVAPLVVTTPMSGWFTCAGERATGIAVALETAEIVAADYPVLVVATTGHELEHLGARRWLADTDVSPRAVLHCGASLAAGAVTDTVCELSEARIAMTNTDGGSLARITDLLAPVRITAIPGPEIWGGEGEEWRKFGVPLLSLTGGFDGFHTPDDLPESVTTPKALESVRDAVVETTYVLLRADTSVP